MNTFGLYDVIHLVAQNGVLTERRIRDKVKR